MFFKRSNNQDAQNEISYKGNAVVRLMAYVKPYRKVVLLSCLLVLIITALELFKPILIGNAIDQYITLESGETSLTPDERFLGVVKTVGLYILLLVVLFLCSRCQYMLMQKTGQNIIYTMRNELFEHMEKLTMRYFDITPVGKIVTRITNDVESINDLYANMLVNLFRNFVKIIGYVVIMLSLDTRMALYSFVTLPAITVLIVVYRTIARKTYLVLKTRLTALNTFLSENLSGMKLIQIFNREKEKYREFCGKSEDMFNASYREMMVYCVFTPLVYFGSVVALCIILGTGANGYLHLGLSLGTLFVFVQYIQNFFDPIQSLATQLSTVQSAMASAEKIFTLLDTEPAIPEETNPVQLPEVTGRIEFDHVWFAYEGENYILKDVSFTIEPGQRVAFVGATGAGKSSILNLIGRYYDIQKGQIRIDGVDIRKLSRQQIRRAIGQVQQDVFIFTGDIAGNIRLRDDTISNETIRACAEHTNAARFIEKLPNGYDERVTERGSTFSAGQRQLLSFARTLAYDPKILILDEATANIDTETEQWIQEALERLMQGRTTIMVAHRLSTIQHADKIIVMHHGRIRESGTHQELLDLNGIYKKLYQLQLA